MFRSLKKMITKSSQQQKAGASSTNVQGQQIAVHQGISYSDARDIATDIFRANFLDLKHEASEIAQSRAEEVTEKILSKLQERHPGSIDEFKEPGLQDALFNVQKQYAISGDSDLGDLLVDILVDRAAEPKRGMLQIVLDESLLIAPKLTLEQLDTLTLGFLLVRTRRLDAKNYSDLISHFRKRVVPFVARMSDKHSDYTHMEYLGCGQVRAGNYGKLEDKLRDAYKAYFSNGFDGATLESKVRPGTNLRGLVITCFHDQTKLQIGAINEDILQTLADRNGLDPDAKKGLLELFESSTKPSSEVKDMLVGEIPELQRVFKVWNESSFYQFELSDVGIAIAHANYRRSLGETMDLSIWIN